MSTQEKEVVCKTTAFKLGESKTKLGTAQSQKSGSRQIIFSSEDFNSEIDAKSVCVCV